MQKVTVRVPGSCGELIQGSFKGEDFLVSCPINLYTKATAYFGDSRPGLNNQVLINKKIVNSFAGYEIEEISTERTKKAAAELLRYYNISGGRIKIDISSELIPGIGMASSTADISAAAAAVMLLLRNKVDFGLLKKICLELEPTDSVFLSGIRIFDHRQGRRDIFLSSEADIDILLFKEKGVVDSLEFNQLPDLFSQNTAKEKVLKKSLRLIKTGLKTGNYYLLGRGSTISALAHQELLFKENLDKLLKITVGSDQIYGLNIAHSGTVTGILIKQDFNSDKLVNKIKKQTSLKFIKKVKMISGGIERKIDNGASAWRKIEAGSSSE